MGEGEDYEKINRAVSILISYHTLLEERKEFHHRFRLYDDRTQIYYPDSPEINILEVKKARGAQDSPSPLTNWLRFFAAETAEEFMSVAQTNPAIAEAWQVIQYLSADEEARMLAEYEEKARRDEADRQKGAYSKGLQEGRQEGRLEVAKNLLQEKLPAETVVRLTGLSLEEVKSLYRPASSG
jgi:predicted transposase/invertase (TIGR01784 family)